MIHLVVANAGRDCFGGSGLGDGRTATSKARVEASAQAKQALAIARATFAWEVTR